MIKKYILILAILMTILLFTSTSTASFSYSKERIYERLQIQQDTAFRNFLRWPSSD